MQLFVYGSLLRGMSLSKTMEGTQFLGPAYVKADLFFLGFYPGIVAGSQIVFGELYEVPDRILPKIDEVEDYIELDNEKSVYLRQPIDAFRLSDGTKINASAYYYNRSSAGKQRIESGDYRIFMANLKNENTWLVSYGSTMSSKKIYAKLGFIPEHKVGFVQGFERVFNVKSGINGYAFANLSYTGGKKVCESVAWKLNNDQIIKLDEFKNVPQTYHRLSMPFTTNEGETIIAHIYLANTSHLSSNLHPDPNYLKLVNSGKLEHNIYQD
jgi:gamma-glutamylcyclotransferase (GGCT)/AIG2-like uncharacterized protein YtfP